MAINSKGDLPPPISPIKPPISPIKPPDTTNPPDNTIEIHPLAKAMKDEKSDQTATLIEYLQKLSQKLKNPQTANYPPTCIAIAYELDQVIRDLGAPTAAPSKTPAK